VSGTAAIRGEQSEETHSAQQQTITTIENIKHLTSTENLVRYGCSPHKLQYRQIRVFIKRKEDYEEVKSVVEKAYPQVEVVYTLADVCRSELLVEIEGILTT
jgi:spore coat polysaccharide biosynthesis protein SpsF (cytidylyltransferase family)